MIRMTGAGAYDEYELCILSESAAQILLFMGILVI